LDDGRVVPEPWRLRPAGGIGAERGRQPGFEARVERAGGRVDGAWSVVGLLLLLELGFLALLVDQHDRGVGQDLDRIAVFLFFTIRCLQPR